MKKYILQKRNNSALETEMDTIFQAEFPANYIAYLTFYLLCEIADVNLPENVKTCYH